MMRIIRRLTDIVIEKADDKNSEKVWAKIDLLAARYEPLLARAINEALKSMRDQLDGDALLAALENNDIGTALGMLRIDNADVLMTAARDVLRDATVAAGRYETGTPEFQAALAATAAANISYAPTTFAPVLAEFRFDGLNPNTVEFMRRYELNLINEISNRTREALRTTLLDGISAGTNPRAVARDIKTVVGLTEKQAQAVINFRRQLETFHLRRSVDAWNLGGKVSRAPGGAQVSILDDKGSPVDGITERRLRDFRYDAKLKAAFESGKPLAPGQIDKMVDAYASKYRKLRAESIARTEAMRASNAGILDSWQQAAAKGSVVLELLRKSWIRARDERTCPICRPMPDLNRGDEGFGIPIDQRFLTGDGDYVMSGPVHTSCRCSIFVRMIEKVMVGRRIDLKLPPIG